MGVGRRCGAVLVLVAAAAATAVLGSGTAHACSCMETDPIDAIARVDAVFIGAPVEQVSPADLAAGQVAWRFDVEAVVTGTVTVDQIVVDAYAATTCGPLYSAATGRTVVYASIDGAHLYGAACLGAGDVDEFIARVETPIPGPSGTGAPAAVRVGVVGGSDVAVLDREGQTLSAAYLGVTDSAFPAVCPGTTRVALVTGEPAGHVMVVDLADLTVTDARDAELPWLEPLWVPIACYDGGDRVVTASSVNEDGRLRIVSSTRTGTISYQADPGFGSVALHPDGTAFLLPVDGSVGLRTLRVDDLTVVGNDIALPAGASITDGAVSPDRTQLVLLGRLDGTPAVGRTPSTHVLVIGLVDGVPEGPVRVVALDPASVALPEGPGLEIEWVDDTTWVIEHVGNFTDWFEFVTTGGTQLLAPTDVGEGAILAPVPGGVLRHAGGGIQRVSLDGSTTAGDPSPGESPERWLRIASLRPAAPFTPVAVEVEPRHISEPLPAVGDATAASGSSGLWIALATAGGLAVVLIAFVVVPKRMRLTAR